jgi:hypothetical protein
MDRGRVLWARDFLSSRPLSPHRERETSNTFKLTLLPRAILIAAALLMLTPGEASAETSFPGNTWGTADPAASGWSMRRLREARDYFGNTGATGLLVVHNGRVIASWGDTEQQQKIASVRKSFLSALYGLAVEKGQIDLDRTMGGTSASTTSPRGSPQRRRTRPSAISSRGARASITRRRRSRRR